MNKYILLIIVLVKLSSCTEIQEGPIPIYQIAKCEIPISIDQSLLCNPKNLNLRNRIIVTQQTDNGHIDTIGYRIVELRGNKGEGTIKEFSNNDQIIFHTEYLATGSISIDTLNNGSSNEIIERSYKGQKKYIKQWHTNGNLKSELNYSSGLLTGIETQYHTNGRIKETGMNKQKNRLTSSEKSGEWIYYSETGNIYKSISYVNGSQIGEYKEFFESGKVKVKGNYYYGKGKCENHIFDYSTYETTIEYFECDSASVKQGNWIHYNESGGINFIKEYKKTESNRVDGPISGN